MLPIEWDARAKTDLRAVITYIATRNSRAAQSLKSVIEGSVERLSLFPYSHRTGRLSGTREMVVHPNYIVVYAVRTDAIRILRVLHARQQYP